MQQLPVRPIGCHGLDQVLIQSGEFGLQVTVVGLDVFQHETMAGGQFTLQGSLQRLAFVAHHAFGQIGELPDGLAGDEALDHGTGGNTIDVGDDGTELDAGIVEDLVQAILFAGVHLAELLPVAGNQPQFTQILGRNEAGTDQAETAQLGPPLRIGDIGLATGDIFHMPGVDHMGRNTGGFQCRINTFPIDAGAFQDDQFDIQRCNQATSARTSRWKPVN